MSGNIKKIVEQIHPLQRMINSSGMDAAFDIVKEHLPDLVIHEYQPGDVADDWEVPFSWNLVKGYLKNEKGEIIASHNDSHLFVAAYSEPVCGKFSKDEISKHMRCHPVKKDAFFMEHRNAYNHSIVDWGITLPQNIWDKMPSADYEVLIEVEKDFKRSMKVGEVFIKGKSEKIICFTAHIDELCNDNLSSCAVLIEYFKHFKEHFGHIPEYSYQLLLIPEVIGTFFYVKNNIEKIKNTVSMINLETVGRGENWLIKQSFKADQYIDRLMELVADHVLKDYKVSNMFGGYGNEERVYEYPTIRIPSAALQRFSFDEYHSSADTPDKLSEEHLNTAFEFVRYLINIIEKDFIPSYTLMLPPWLTKHGLYFDSKDQPELFEVFMNQVQFNIDDKNSAADLCWKYDIEFETLHSYLCQFVTKKFITVRPTYDLWKD